MCSRPLLAHRDQSDVRPTCLESGDKRTLVRSAIDANDPQETLRVEATGHIGLGFPPGRDMVILATTSAASTGPMPRREFMSQFLSAAHARSAFRATRPPGESDGRPSSMAAFR